MTRAKLEPIRPYQTRQERMEAPPEHEWGTQI